MKRAALALSILVAASTNGAAFVVQAEDIVAVRHRDVTVSIKFTRGEAALTGVDGQPVDFAFVLPEALLRHLRVSRVTWSSTLAIVDCKFPDRAMAARFAALVEAVRVDTHRSKQTMGPTASHRFAWLSMSSINQFAATFLVRSS